MGRMMDRLNEIAEAERARIAEKEFAKSVKGYTLMDVVECAHCKAVGGVYRKVTKVKRGVSGGKATGAVITAGTSVLATGLSRKQEVSLMICKSCEMTWTIE